MVISKFINRAKEVEVDGVSDGENVLIGAIMEHVENAGVHSGDATMTIPPQALKLEVQKKIEDCTQRIVKALNNSWTIQHPVPRQRRCCKRHRMQPAGFAFNAVCQQNSWNKPYRAGYIGDAGQENHHRLSPMTVARHVGVKVPQFSFMRLSGADPVLGVEMLSTGEVACLGENFSDAFSKALQSAEFSIPSRDGTVFISVGGDQERKTTRRAHR